MTLTRADEAREDDPKPYGDPDERLRAALLAQRDPEFRARMLAEADADPGMAEFVEACRESQAEVDRINAGIDRAIAEAIENGVRDYKALRQAAYDAPGVLAEHLDYARQAAYDAMRAEVEERPSRRESSSPAPHLSLVTLESVEERPARFFDRPLLQTGSFHILAARKGAGKGTYLSDRAAAVTRGDLGERRNVVWISSEDSAAQDIRPRVAVAGGDLSRVYVVDSGWLELPRDVEAIREAVERIGDVALVVIDPISNHLRPGTNSNDDGGVREAIAPLNHLADSLDTSIVGIRHLTEKAGRAEVLGAILGASAWVHVPRVVLGIIEDDQESDLRHIRVFRGNRVAPDEAALLFRITGVPRDGFEMDVPRLEWAGASSKDLDDLFAGKRGRSKTATAREALLDTLTANPGGVESDALDAQVARQTGLTEKSVRNLRSQMSDQDLIRSVPERDEYGKVLAWIVVLGEKATRDLASPDPDFSKGDV